MKKKLKTELKELLTDGWTDWERDTQWKSYLETEIKTHYPSIYKIFEK